MTLPRFSLFLGMALALLSVPGLVMAQNTLSPDIEGERLLLRARKAHGKKNWRGAEARFIEIQALDGTLPEDFHYFYGLTLRKRKKLEGAKKQMFLYIERSGRKAKYFNNALETLNDLEDVENRNSRRKKKRKKPSMAGKGPEKRKNEKPKVKIRDKVKAVLLSLPHKGLSRAIWKEPSSGIDFIAVKGGTFQMGCHEAAGKCDLDEGPARMVRLDDFWMGRFEVTQGQWLKIMGKNPSQYPEKPARKSKPLKDATRSRYPVENVSWTDAQNFIRRLNRKSKARFRLPSEAEWEYACRAEGKRVRFGTANGKLNTKAGNYKGAQDGHRKTAPVGKYPPNALGLYEMSGNVLEWIEDNYSENFHGAGTENPIHADPGTGRGARGGSWNSGFERNLRCSHRDSFDPSVRYGFLGFRLVRMK